MSDSKKRAERIAGDAVISSMGADLRKKYEQKQCNRRIIMGAAFAAVVASVCVGYQAYLSLSDYSGSLNAKIDDSPEVTADEQTNEAETNEEGKDSLSTIIRGLSEPSSP